MSQSLLDSGFALIELNLFCNLIYSSHIRSFIFLIVPMKLINNKKVIKVLLIITAKRRRSKIIRIVIRTRFTLSVTY